uniref:Uncharacterized protein n=1 Tax=Pseudo-nitzschia australis TaxID=44445 RepID=A0A7S4AK36_9STRA
MAAPTTTNEATTTTSNDDENENDYHNDNCSLAPPNHPEWDCLLIASQKGDDSRVRKVLSEHPSSKSHANPMGQSALHIAAWWGRFECLRVLLKHGADVHASNYSSGATPLHECLGSSNVRRSRAQRRRRIECTKLLLEANADADCLDGSGKTPLECFVVASGDGEDDDDDDDLRDCSEIEKLLLLAKTRARERERARAVDSPLRALVEKLGSNDVYVDADLDRIWFEKILPNLELEATPTSLLKDHLLQYQHHRVDSMLSITWTLLSTQLLAMIRAWIDEQAEICSHDNWLGRIAWIWKKLLELPIGFENTVVKHNDGQDCDDNNSNMNKNDDSDSIPALDLDSTRETALKILCMGIFHRYEHLWKEIRCSRNGNDNDTKSSLLQDDSTLSSWIKTVILLLMPDRDDSASTEDGPSRNTYNSNHSDDDLHQAWITIARRDYFELAELWWDRLGISPIGIVNRQGMTALHFAARSGRFRMVRWFLHQSFATDEKRQTSRLLSDWVQHRDQRGQTALMAATSNQHEQIVKLLQQQQDYTTPIDGQ